MSRSKVVLFVDIFPPSMGGGATRAFQVARSLYALGCNVIVVTTSCNYPVGKSVLAFKSSRQQQDGIEVIRVPSLNLPFKGLINRMLNYLSSGFFLLKMVPKLKKVDLIFSLGMHPFTDVAAYLTKMVNPKSRFVIDISDIFPERGIFRVNNIIINKILLRLSDAISVHNERMKEVFLRRYKCNKKVTVLYNAVDTAVFRPNNSSKKDKVLLSTLCGRSLTDSFLICYFGVIGPFQGLDIVLRAVAMLKEEVNDVVICIIGEGEGKRILERSASTLGNAFILPKMPRHKIAQIAAEADVGLVPLVSDDPFVVHVNLPSKAAEFLSCGVPILVAKGSFIGHLVSRWDAGYEVNFNDAENLCIMLRYIYANRDELTRKSVKARLLAVQVFSLEAMQKALVSLVKMNAK